MALVQVPRIKLERNPDDIIKNLQIALERFRADFDNAAANAINPSDVESPNSGPHSGAGGAGALTITDPPTNITLMTGSQLNPTNHTREAFIDVTFTKPANAVGVEIYYRESGEANEPFRQTYANSSPYRILHLLPGVPYTIQCAGEAANGSLGPASQVQTITTPGDESEVASINTPYVVTASTPGLTDEHVLQGETGVMTVDTPPGLATIGLAPLGVTTAKLANNAITTAKLADDAITTEKRQALLTLDQRVTLTGRNAPTEILTTTTTFPHNLGKRPLVTLSLTNITGESDQANLVALNIQSHTDDETTVRVVGLFFNSLATLEATVNIYYW